jgi:hypothetical protein
MSRLACVLLVGCYAPNPAEGTPCTTSADCPAPLACFGGHCLAEPPKADASTSDAGNDALVDAAMATCPPGALQCDDFETGTITAWTKSISGAGSGSTLMIAQAPVHAGRFALDADVPMQTSSGQSAYVARVTATAQSTGMLATRAYVFAPAAIAAFSGVIQYSFGDHAQYVGVYGDTDGKWDVTEQSTAGLVDHASTLGTKSQQWTCVELDYTFEQPHFVLYIDDTVVLDLDATDPAPKFSEAGVGVTRAPTGGFHVFADDIVIATSHIGC